MKTSITQLRFGTLIPVAMLTLSFNAHSGDKETPLKRAQIAAPVAAQPSDAEPKDPQSSRKKALVWSAVVKVANPDEARAAVEKETRLLKGYAMYFNDSSIQVKIPPEALTDLTAKIGKLGMVLEKSLSSEDLTLRIAELEGMLKSKRDIMERTRKFLDNSDVPSTLEIERTMTGLVSEIEQLRGQLRVLYDRSAYAVVDVSFQFRERDKIVYVQSPFEWLNTVDLSRLVSEF